MANFKSRADIVRDEPQEIPAGFTAESASELREAIRRLARTIESRNRFVDEYQTQTSATMATQSVLLQPQFEAYWEIIDRIIITGPAVPSLQPLTTRGTVTNPAGGATITSAGPGVAGVQYQVTWDVELEGTVTAADADNMRLTGAGGLTLGAAYPGAVGIYPQEPVYFVSDGVTNLVVKAIAAASGVSAIYGAQITAIPLAPTFTLQLGDRFWNLALPPSGLLEFSAGIMLSRVDIRKLSSSVSGPWNLELTGRADVRNRE